MPRTVPQVTVYPTHTAEPNTAQPTATTASALNVLARYDGQWRTIKPGIEQINFRGQVSSTAGLVDEMLVVVRLDPNRVQLKVFYSPTTPRRVRDWLHYQQADVAINGGYFNDQNVATALVIVDGVATGKSYSGFGGLFALRGNPPNLIPSLQWLKTKPYRPDKRIRYALQGSPMLVTEGTTVPGISDNGERNRRSFIALDKQGRVLLGICQFAQWTLTDLANYLAETKALEIQNALNLDGGASTGLWVNSEDDSTLTDSFEQVPLVIVGSSN